MITRRTKIQLLVFVIITLVGVSYVGARYAQLDRLVLDRTYEVTAHFDESGGIFVGGEVTYRGVRIGDVSDMILTSEGVDVVLEIDNEWDEIPAEAKALVGNRSAIGEQYVELQPSADDGPFLEDGSEITITEVPIRTEKLLADVSRTVTDVDQQALQTTVRELGIAFDGTGEDLQQIIDTGNSFIAEANDKFDVTTALIESSNTVLNGQVASESSLRQFADQLSQFSTTMVGADADLRRVIDSGSFTANQLRTFLQELEVPMSELMRNLVTTGEVVVRRLPGIEHTLVIFPWLIDGTWSVVDNKGSSGLYDAHFGLILTDTETCKAGYAPGGQRPPGDGEYRQLDSADRCAEGLPKNARGAQTLPRTAPDLDGPDPSKVLGSYDSETGEFTWGTAEEAPLAETGTVAPPDFGKDSWKWLYLQPLLEHQG